MNTTSEIDYKYVPPLKVDGKRDRGVFKFKHFTLRHDNVAMKIGTDAILIGGYSSLESTILSFPPQNIWDDVPFILDSKHNLEDEIIKHDIDYWPKRILDIGCGSGVISIMLLQSYPQSFIDSVDIDLDAIKQSLYNIDQLPYDSWKRRISVHHTPIQNYQPLPLSNFFVIPEESSGGEISKSVLYDLIVCAPPWFLSSIEKDTRVSAMDDKRRIARHTHALTMEELVQKVTELIVPETGRFKVILSLPHPANEFLELATNVGLHCLERVYVRDNPNSKIIRYIDTYNYLPNNQVSPVIDVERNFSIYVASYQEQPLLHRIYTNQYKWMLSDLCVHMLKEEDYKKDKISEENKNVNENTS